MLPIMPTVAATPGSFAEKRSLDACSDGRSRSSDERRDRRRVSAIPCLLQIGDRG